MSANGKKLAGKVAVVTGASEGDRRRHRQAPGRRGGGRGRQLRLEQGRCRARRCRDRRQGRQGHRRPGQRHQARRTSNGCLPRRRRRSASSTSSSTTPASTSSRRSRSVTAEHFHKLFDLNVLGLILTSQEAVKHFGASGGSIVNISSVVATSAPPNTVGLQRDQGRRRRRHQVACQGAGPA